MLILQTHDPTKEHRGCNAPPAGGESWVSGTWRPAVFLGIGPTGSRALDECRRRMARRFDRALADCAFLHVVEGPGGAEARLLAGEACERFEVPSGLNAGSAAREGLRCALQALRRLSRRGGGSGRDLGREATLIEVVVVARLAELSDADALLEPMRYLSREDILSWRLGILWTSRLPRGREEEGGCLAPRDPVLSAIDGGQDATDGRVRYPPFHACFFLDPRSTTTEEAEDGMDPEESVSLTAAFLASYAGSDLGIRLREFCHPQPAPWRFHLGLAERSLDSEGLEGHLLDLWLSEAATILEAANEAPPARVEGVESLSVGALEGQNPEAAARLVRQCVGSILARAANDMGAEKRDEWSASGLVTRAEAVLAGGVAAFRSLQSEWQHHLARCHRQLVQCRLELALRCPSPIPLAREDLRAGRRGAPSRPFGPGRRLLRGLDRRWVAVWTFYMAVTAALTFSAHSAWLEHLRGGWRYLGAGIILSLYLVPVVFFRLPWRIRAPKRRFLASRRRELRKEIRRLERSVSLAQAVIGAEDRFPQESWQDHRPASAGSLVEAIASLELARLELLRLSDALAKRKRGGTRGSPGAAGFPPPAALRRLLIDLLRGNWTAAACSGTLSGPLPRADDLIRVSVDRALGPESLQLLFECGHEKFVEALAEEGRKCFRGGRAVSPEDLLRLLEEDGRNLASVRLRLLSDMASEATVLWPIRTSANGPERIYLVHSPPWSGSAMRLVRTSLGHFEEIAAPGRGNLLLLRLVRGQPWSS